MSRRHAGISLRPYLTVVSHWPSVVAHRHEFILHFFYVANEPSSLLYALRVLAFGIIIAAIVDKNLA